MSRFIASVMLITAASTACSSTPSMPMMTSTSASTGSCKPATLTITQVALAPGSSSQCPTLSASSLTPTGGSGACVPTEEGCTAFFDCTATAASGMVEFSGTADSDDDGATYTNSVDGFGCTYQVTIAPSP